MSLLEVVNDQDEVIGLKPRAEIHAQGLRHREVHVWLVTPQQQVVLQRRSATKDTYPNYLNASIGGHVEPGRSYLETACIEAYEETGLNVKAADLVEIAKMDTTQLISGSLTNIVFRMIYLLPWQGELADLHVEAADGAGFELMPIAEIMQRIPETAGDLIPGLVTPDYQAVWQKIAHNFQQSTVNSQL